MKYPLRKVMTFKKPCIKKGKTQYGLPYKETFQLIADAETNQMGVYIKRITQYPTSTWADPQNERLVRFYNGKYYTLQEYAVKLDYFYDAFEHFVNFLSEMKINAELDAEEELLDELAEDRKILINQIRTPDGTILISKHRHDYVTYVDANGLEYMVDGGTAYLRRNVHTEAPYEELTIYEGDDIDFEYFRTVYCRGGRGKDGTEPLKWVPLAEMSNDWINNVVTYEEEHRPSNPYLPIYRQEVQYRKDNNIFIED